MPMGNIESYYQVVPASIVNKVVGAEAGKDCAEKLKLLKESLKISDSDINDELNDEGDIDQESKEWLAFKKAYDTVCETFKTKTGLTLCALYTEGDGDCYDDLESYTWYWVIPEHEVWIRKTTEKAAEFIKKYGEGAIDTDQRFSQFG